MRRLLVVMPVLLALTGCGDGMYYQTRYIPTGADTYYSMELPAAPPDLEGEHPAREECVYPYQKFKTIGKVQYKAEDIHSNGGTDGATIANTDQRMRMDGPTKPLPGPAVMAVSTSPYVAGLTQPSFQQQAGGKDLRPHSTTGAGTDVTATPITVDGGANSKNYNPYCCGDGPGTGTTNEFRDVSGGR
jgi:hypothetical protein